MIDENPNPMMHTRRLDAENVRVAVMFVEDKHMNDPLPIPVDDEMVILSDAIKSIVAWPKRLVIPDDEEVSIFWFLVILYITIDVIESVCRFSYEARRRKANQLRSRLERNHNLTHLLLRLSHSLKMSLIQLRRCWILWQTLQTIIYTLWTPIL